MGAPRRRRPPNAWPNAPVSLCRSRRRAELPAAERSSSRRGGAGSDLAEASSEGPRNRHRPRRPLRMALRSAAPMRSSCDSPQQRGAIDLSWWFLSSGDGHVATHPRWSSSRGSAWNGDPRALGCEWCVPPTPGMCTSPQVVLVIPAHVGGRGRLRNGMQKGPARNSAGPGPSRNVSTRAARVSLG